MDEYQLYINCLRANGEQTWEDARQEFKQMLKEIGNVMRGLQDNGEQQFFILPICTGTSAVDLHFLPMEYGKRMLQIKPLDIIAAKSMFYDKFQFDAREAATNARNSRAMESLEKHLPNSNIRVLPLAKIQQRSKELCDHVWAQPHFKIALYDSAFIPRFIHFLLSTGILSTNHDWGKELLVKVRNGYGSAKIGDGPGTWRSYDEIRTTISLAITHQPITRDFKLSSGRTIGEIERDGFLHLSQ
ncbi:hypothetical protein BGZ49_002318, partial [Haplosporangium sp. Z 27]